MYRLKFTSLNTFLTLLSWLNNDKLIHITYIKWLSGLFNDKQKLTSSDPQGTAGVEDRTKEKN